MPRDVIFENVYCARKLGLVEGEAFAVRYKPKVKMAERREVPRWALIGAGLFGCLLVICGIGNVACGGMFLGQKNSAHAPFSRGLGFWSGVVMLITGFVGVAALIAKNKIVFGLYFSMTIISLVIAIVQSALAGVAYTLLQLVTKGKCWMSDGTCECRDVGTRVTLTSFQCPRSDLDYSAVNEYLIAIMAISIIATLISFLTMLMSCIGCMFTCLTRQHWSTRSQGHAFPPTTGYPSTQPGAYPMTQSEYPTQVQYPTPVFPASDGQN
ncbi:uncharacterized protein LOC116618719 [Nematostella vectensis]|uniref:uncharacterized protein LOC116618719 n=1 Tax=Nematostella vectensis TaxID=45351 RepID=UPI002077495C|nr:uncharacterized protein LOC116618719 [Nematostella vectensis]